MKALLTGCLSLALFALTMMPVPAEAATPQDGRYKGTITIRTVVDGTNARVKKVIPVAGQLASGTLFLVMAERPELPTYFTSSFFNCTVSDGAVTLRSNNNANWITLNDVTTTTSAINGSTDFGVFAPPTGSGAARVFLVFAVTRVGS
jgi:hypothetical protein